MGVIAEDEIAAGGICPAGLVEGAGAIVADVLVVRDLEGSAAEIVNALAGVYIADVQAIAVAVRTGDRGGAAGLRDRSRIFKAYGYTSGNREGAATERKCAARVRQSG